MDNCDWETKISNNEKSVYAYGHTILTITFTACVRHANSEGSENGSHGSQTLKGGGSNIILCDANAE